MPFAGYEDFADCVSKNQDKEDPDAYCGKIKHQVMIMVNVIFIKRKLVHGIKNHV